MKQNRYSKLGYTPIKSVERSDVPMTRTVKTDQMTDMANECFDLPFDGQCKFYPFIMPEIPEYRTLVITGRSGSGKSTLLSTFNYKPSRQYNPGEYIMTTFSRLGMTFDDFMERINSAGLNIEDILFKHYGDLSEGEKFRADVAFQIDSNVIFDEFTSMVDRTVAKTVCEGLRQYIDKNNLTGVVMCSCHKDFIEWMRPDLVIDLDDATVYAIDGQKTTSEETNVEEELIGSFKI